MGCRCEDLHSWMLMLHLEENTSTMDIISRMSMFQEPEQIFPLVSSLKEEGNKLVKLGDFEHAFTIYTKAVTFLVLGLPCCAQGSHPFKDLAIPLNLNLAMCALKLSKFYWAKCLCDCVLHYEPTNVKALFRRASAALRLGQLEAAKNDLTIAKNVEPNNGDVLKKWNMVNLLLFEATGNDVNSSSCDSMEVDAKSVVSTISLGVQNLGFNPLNLPTKNHSHPADQIESESVGSNMNGTCIDNLVGSEANLSNAFVDPPRVNTELEDTISISGSSCPFLKTNLAEPKRFSNQSRPGSILNLSPPDYKRLAAGQVLCYHDPHSFGFMSVRVKRFTSNHDSIPEIQEVKSPSATFSETMVNVGDSVTHILPSQSVTTDDVNDTTHTSMQTIHQAPPTFAVAPNHIREPLNRHKVTNSSGMGSSRLARRHPFVPTFNSKGDKRQLKRPIKRIAEPRVRPIPGMKRKGMSNTFISSYPAWKRRVICNREEKFQVVVDCDRNPLSCSPGTTTLQRVHDDLMSSTLTSFSGIVMNNLNISL